MSDLDFNIEFKGSLAGANQAALTSNTTSLTNTSSNTVDGTSGGTGNRRFYFYQTEAKSLKTYDFLIEFIPKILANYQWKKSMKWGEYDLNWGRPLKSILSIFDKKIVSFNFHHLVSSNSTFIDKDLEEKIDNYVIVPLMDDNQGGDQYDSIQAYYYDSIPKRFHRLNGYELSIARDEIKPLLLELISASGVENFTIPRDTYIEIYSAETIKEAQNIISDYFDN